MTAAEETTRLALPRRGFALEWATLSWNVAGIVLLAVAAVSARSVALAGFGLDSLIEIGASTVVIWELSATREARQRRALRMIGAAFALLAVYLLIQSTWVLATGYHPRHSLAGIGWTALTAVAMFTLAAGKVRTGAALATRCCAPKAGSPWSTASSPPRSWQGWFSMPVLAGGLIPPRATCSSSTPPPARSARSSPPGSNRAPPQRRVAGWHAHAHDLPAHARRPSTNAQPAIPSATTPSSHQAPNSVLAASPANTAMAR